MSNERTDQVCLRMRQSAYKALNEMTGSLKDKSTRQWTNSALVNILIMRARKEILNLDEKEALKLYGSYADMLREDGKHAQSK